MTDTSIPDGFSRVESSATKTVEQMRRLTPETCRLTGNYMLHFQQDGAEPIHVQGVMSTVYDKSGKDAIKANLKIGEDQEELAFGFFKDAFLVCIENRVGSGLLVNPTENEKREYAKQVIEVRLTPDGPPLLVRPGTFTVIQPDGPLYIRSRYKEASFILFATPKKAN